MPQTTVRADGDALPREGTCCDNASRSNHDLLLSFESRGMAGVQYVLEAMERSSDHEGDKDSLMWMDLPDFIAQHNWQDPYAVYVLGQFIETALRDRIEAHKIRTVGQSVVALKTAVGDTTEVNGRIDHLLRSLGFVADLLGRLLADLAAPGLDQQAS